MTDKENWQEKPGEGESSARRDGERKSESNPWRKPTESRGYQGNSNDRPRRNFSDNNSGGFNRGGSSSSSDRPQRSFGEGNSDRPRRTFGDSGNSFNNNNGPRRSFGEGNDRPQRPFDGNSDRPRRSFGEGGNDRPQRSFDGNSDRPRRTFGEGGNDRPQRSFGDNNGNRFGAPDREKNSFDRPRRSFGEGDNNDRPRRSFDDNNSERPRRSFGDNNDRPKRPFNESGNKFGGQSREGGFDRPRRGAGEDSFDKPRRSFGENSGSDSPRKSFGDNGNRFGGSEGGNSFDRPRRSFGEGGGDSPRRSFGDSGNDRPRRSFGDGGNDRPRRPFGEGGNDRPRRAGGEGFGSQARPTFRGPSLPKPDRTDGRPRRPRIKKESSFDHGTPYGRSTSQPILDPNEPIRLNKYLANAGICSRREADEFIQAGVVKVNGETVTELGVKVKPVDTILFHDQQVSIERKVYILLNKPKDCVTTSDDPQERLTVMDLVKGACFERIYPVGRLDRNTTGVLLLTNDGDLASKLTHPKFEKRKIYQVTLDNDLKEADFSTILDGVTLDEELIKVDNLSIVDPDKKNVVGIEIHSGQNRVVRRIFESLGYKVFKLDRVYFAGLTKKNLPRGKWRHLSDKEVSLLKMGAFV